MSHPAPQPLKSPITFDHVGVVVDDLEATVQFFEKLGFLRQGSFVVDGPWVDRITGLAGARVAGICVSAPDGTGALEFLKFHEPARLQELAVPPAHAHGIRHIAYRVSDIEAMVAQARAAGYDTVGEIVNRKDSELLAYIRGPEGLIVELAQPL